MKVILTERVQSLGNVGEIVNVSPGYARNFLIPESKAVLADEGNKKWLENQKRQLAKKVEEEKKAATDLKGQIDGLTLDFERRVAGNGKLFGTITAMELSKAFAAKNLEVEKRWIVISEPIKALGTFEVAAKIVNGVEAKFNVKVEMDPKQVEENKAKEAAAKKRKAKQAEEDKAAAEAAKAEGENASSESADAEATPENA